MPYATTATARVAYTIEGSGPGLVLVHGTGSDGFSNWGHLARHFAAKHTVICPDYAGSGTTSDHGGPLQLTELADQVLAAASAAGQTQFDLVGFSLGAVVAAQIAAEHPQRVRSLVLIAGFAGGPEPRAQLQFGLWRDLIASNREAMARLMLLTGFSSAFLASLPAAELAKRQAAVLRFTQWQGMLRQTELDLRLDIRDTITRITAPTLVIGCTQDHMVPPALVQTLAASIAGAAYLEIDSGHLVPLEKPRELAAAIIAHIEAPHR